MCKQHVHQARRDVYDLAIVVIVMMLAQSACASTWTRFNISSGGHSFVYETAGAIVNSPTNGYQFVAAGEHMDDLFLYRIDLSTFAVDRLLADPSMTSPNENTPGSVYVEATQTLYVVARSTPNTDVVLYICNADTLSCTRAYIQSSNSLTLQHNQHTIAYDSTSVPNKVVVAFRTTLGEVVVFRCNADGTSPDTPLALLSTLSQPPSSLNTPALVIFDSTIIIAGMNANAAANRLTAAVCSLTLSCTFRDISALAGQGDGSGLLEGEPDRHIIVHDSTSSSVYVTARGPSSSVVLFVCNEAISTCSFRTLALSYFAGMPTIALDQRTGGLLFGAQITSPSPAIFSALVVRTDLAGVVTQQLDAGNAPSRFADWFQIAYNPETTCALGWSSPNDLGFTPCTYLLVSLHSCFIRTCSSALS